MSDTIINKVAESGLITIDLANYYPSEEVKSFDLKDYLFRGLILKEKDFREALKNTNWEDFRGKSIGVVCTADAIIPLWAYMLVVSCLQPVANDVILGGKEEVIRTRLLKNINGLNLDEYIDQRVVIKGCGEKKIDEAVYMEITKLLIPIARTIMYGEPCSTVPVYKRKS